MFSNNVKLMLTHLDRAKQQEFLENTQHLTQRMVNTIWVLLARDLYFANNHGSMDGETAVAANAKSSRKAQREKTKDGGCQGYMRRLKAKGFKLCCDPKSLFEAEECLEKLGIAEFEREGYGRVAIAHINLRAAALFLELFHPDFEWLEQTFDGAFNWLKPFCDKILGRGFNRRDEYDDGLQDRHDEGDIAKFNVRFPPKRFDFTKLPGHIVAMFTRFCRRVTAATRDYCVRGCVYWDVDISNPPEFA